jgi:addiction module HigA family antidote
MMAATASQGPPTHPGELLSEDVVPALALPKAEIARRLGISRQTLDEKQPVMPAMAVRLGKFFGNGPDFWLNLQRDYDLRTLKPKMKKELAAMSRWRRETRHLFR